MNIENTVWLLVGISGREQGRLTLGNSRLAFEGENGTRFDVPAAGLGDVKFPWHYFGGGMKVSIGATTYRFSFIEPHNDHASIRDGRSIGAEWKAALSVIKGIAL